LSLIISPGWTGDTYPPYQLGLKPLSLRVLAPLVLHSPTILDETFAPPPSPTTAIQKIMPPRSFKNLRQLAGDLGSDLRGSWAQRILLAAAGTARGRRGGWSQRARASCFCSNRAPPWQPQRGRLRRVTLVMHGRWRRIASVLTRLSLLKLLISGFLVRPELEPNLIRDPCTRPYYISNNFEGRCRGQQP
jgi:hypothetical protein